MNDRSLRGVNLFGIFELAKLPTGETKRASEFPDYQEAHNAHFNARIVALRRISSELFRHHATIRQHFAVT